MPRSKSDKKCKTSALKTTKTLLIEIKENLNKWKDIPCL